MTDLKVNRGFALLEEMLQMTHEEHAGRHGARHQTRRFGLGNSFALQVETKHHSIADLTIVIDDSVDLKDHNVPEVGIILKGKIQQTGETVFVRIGPNKAPKKPSKKATK